jgi:hypothetical protein
LLALNEYFAANQVTHRIRELKAGATRVPAGLQLRPLDRTLLSILAPQGVQRRAADASRNLGLQLIPLHICLGQAHPLVKSRTENKRISAGSSDPFGPRAPLGANKVCISYKTKFAC